MINYQTLIALLAATFLIGSAASAQAAGNSPALDGRPFIWVSDADKADILAKTQSQPWAQAVYAGMVSRVATDLSSHQLDRDALLRTLPVLWDEKRPPNKPASYKTYPAYEEARTDSTPLFDAAVDCAVLFYLTGEDQYARLAADILHNAVTTILPLTPSTNTTNGGWIFTDNTNGFGLLYEARIMGTQLPIVYDFLYDWLQTNQVYDVSSETMVDFSFANAQEFFRTYYELVRDHGNFLSNWSALMATCMLNNLLALDDPAERDAALQVYLTTGTSRQASLNDDYRNYLDPGSIWPESLQYASAVGAIRSFHMVIIERYNPSLNLFDTYPNFPLSLSRIRDLRYPGGKEQISFGDGQRLSEVEPFFEYELIYRHAKDRGYQDLQSHMGALINGGIVDNVYNRSSLMNYDRLGMHNEPLQLLWQESVVTEPAAPLELPRTDRLPYAGITLQRNESPNDDADYGLMGFVGGAGFVHSHASGMSMELFGMGEVMGAKSGRDDNYQTTLNTNYYRLFASNNTVIVNGASIGADGWRNIAIRPVATVSMEPQPVEAAVSANLSFSTSSFNDDKGDLAEATQQRTLAIVRTSNTSGFYVDLFRSDSTVTSRTATTLNGSVTDEYHDYIYRNIGDLEITLEADGAPLPLFDQNDRFQNDVGAQYEQPGWRYFSNTQVSFPHQAELFAQFKATPTGKSSVYMSMHMPAVSTREVAKTDSPPIRDAPDPYKRADSPTLVVRKIGEAWNEPFLSVFEPHFDATGGTVQSTTALRREGTVVGVKVESVVEGRPVTHYVISNPNDNETYTDPELQLSFQGRFGIVADFAGGEYELYIGDGRSIAYRGNTMTSLAGDTEASLLIRPGANPVVTSNAPVEITTALLGSSLAAHWPLNEGSGTTTADVSEYGLDATLLNGASWGSDATRGSFVVFDGNNDRIATPFIYALSSTDDFTWTWWAKSAQPVADGSIMLGNRYGGRGVETYEFIKFTPQGGTLVNGELDDRQFINYDPITNDGWHHYAMVKTGASYQWYVDGVPQGDPVTISYDESTPLPFFIGGDDDGSHARMDEHFEGAIDDVALYRSALTQAEIVNVINAIYFPIITLTTLNTPVDVTDGSTWSDGESVHGGATYVVPATGILRSESGYSIFPGISLTIEAGGRFEILGVEDSFGATKVDPLLLVGGSSWNAGDFAELVAGSGSGVSNVLDGSIVNSGFSRFLTYGTGIERSLKVRSLITGSGRIQAMQDSASGSSSVVISNPENSFSGTWEVAEGSILVFEDAAAVGPADIDVQAGGQLQVEGNWSSVGTLSVADTAGTQVRLQSFVWQVSALWFGGQSVANGVYTASDLNALGANAVFTGIGVVTVGELVEGSPVAHWQFDEGSGTIAIDRFSGGQNGTLLNGVSWGSDATRESFVNFDGIDDRVVTSFTYALSSADDFTWAWWAKYDLSAADGSIMLGNRYRGSGNESLEFIKFMPQGATLVNGGLSDRQNINYAPITNDGWHHYAVVKDGTTFRWYVDGVLSRTDSGLSYSEGDPLPFSIGGDDDNEIPGGREAEHFSGSIDDVVLYARALTTEEVEGVRSGMYAPQATTGQVDWRMAYFGTSENTGVAADEYDANFDGESNLLEFATGQDPLANSLARTEWVVVGEVFEFHYTRSQAAMADGVGFQVMWSDTLLPDSWSASGVVDQLDIENPGNSVIENRIVTVPFGDAGRRFVQLRIFSP